MTPVPYYQDDRVTLYNADCRDVIPHVPTSSVGLLLTDPPYGMSVHTNNAYEQRSRLATAQDYPRVVGDDESFDPTHLLSYKQIVLFGANHYASRLPVSNAWIVWDKLNGISSNRSVGFNDNADCELAWTNFDKVSRIFRHRWMGAMKESEHKDARVHPTQKPIILMQRIIEWRVPEGAFIFDPYAGSGSTVLGALEAGCHAIACEIVQDYCDVIVSRLQAYYSTGMPAEERIPPLPRMRIP